MKILICGFGSIGKKHAQNLSKQDIDLKIWRKRQDQTDEIQKYGYKFEASLDKALSWCDGVIIATSTDEHIPIALSAATLKKAIYIEKPLSHNDDDLDILEQSAENLVVEIGCQLRHHPNLVFLKNHFENSDERILTFNFWVGQSLDQWRPGSDYRQLYSAHKEQGGGALFDLIHEVDLVTWLIGKTRTVYADLRKNSDLEISAHDLANIVLETQNKATGIVQLDMLSPGYRRGFQIVTDQALYEWDFLTATLWHTQQKNKKILHHIEDNFEHACILNYATNHFLERIEKPNMPERCSLKDGIEDMKIIFGAIKSNQQKKQIAINV